MVFCPAVLQDEFCTYMQTELYGQAEALVHQTEVALLRALYTFCVTFTHTHTHTHTHTQTQTHTHTHTNTNTHTHTHTYTHTNTVQHCLFFPVQTNFVLPATTVSAPSNDHINQISHLRDGTIATCSSVSSGRGKGYMCML